MNKDTFGVEFKPTTASKQNGTDFTVWRYGRGWCASDMTLDQLIQIRDALTKFLDEQPKVEIWIARTRGNDPEVHKAGCADVKRGIKSGKYDNDTIMIEVITVTDAARFFWDDFLPGGCAYEEGGPGTGMTDADAQGYTTYLPCTKDLP